MATDYYRAMEQVEKQLPLIGDVVLLGKVEAQPNTAPILGLVAEVVGTGQPRDPTVTVVPAD